MKDALFSQFSDVWSYGILVWEVFNQGQVPYHFFKHDEVEKKVQSYKNIVQVYSSVIDSLFDINYYVGMFARIQADQPLDSIFSGSYKVTIKIHVVIFL